MIDTNTLLQMLQQIHQKNGQVDDVSVAPVQVGQAQPTPASKPGAPSVLGFLGGLGDTKNAQGGIDPSWISQLNQGIMKQTGQGNGYQPFPWQQQPAGQQLGQQFGGGIMNFLSSLL